MNISTNRGYETREGGSTYTKERRVYQPYIRPNKRPRGEGKDKKGGRLQEGHINKDTACSTAQGKDELSQIKKKRESEGGGEEGERIQCTFIQYFFLQRLLVETLRIGKHKTERENKAQVEPKHTYNHPGSRKTQDREKQGKGSERR